MNVLAIALFGLGPIALILILLGVDWEIVLGLWIVATLIMAFTLKKEKTD